MKTKTSRFLIHQTITLAAIFFIVSSASGQIVYSNNFSATGLGNPSTEFSLDAGNGVFNYVASGATIVSTASESIDTGAFQTGFVLSTRFKLNNLAGTGGAITIGFGLLSTGNNFAGTAANPNYQADWFALGTGSGLTVGGLRLQSPGNTAGFTTVGGNSGGGGVIGTTYELRLIGTYDAGTLNMTLALFDENGIQMGTAGTASDTSPLTGNFFGYRNRIAGATHAVDISFDNFVITTTDQPLSISAFTNRTTGMNTSTGPIAFTVSGGAVTASNLIVEANSTNSSLLPPSSFTFSGGGSNRFLTIVPATNQTGIATVTVSVTDGVNTVPRSFVLSVVNEDSFGLTPLWNATPNTQPYFTTTGGTATTPNHRMIAYNSFSNHLYVVARDGSTSSNYNVHVVDGNTGAALYTLNTNGANFTGFAGQVGLNGIDVSDDGSVYVCNVDITSPNLWRLYRWANGNSNTLPQLVFEGDPLGLGSAYRWGDVMDVRGGGTNTEIVLDNLAQSTTTPLMAILRPTDATLTNFTTTFWSVLENPGAGAVSRTLQFGSGNTIWQRRPNTPLILSSFDPATSGSISPIVQNYTNFPTTVGLVAIDQTRNLLGALDFSGINGTSPDRVELYSVTNLSAPVLLSIRDFPLNRVANNGNFGQIIFGGDKLFALDAQNGVVAYRVEIGSSAPPLMTINRSGGDIILTWEGTGFILESAEVLPASNWDNVPYQAGSPNVATVAIGGTAKFFHLRK